MAVSDRTIRNVLVYIAPKFASYGLNLISLPILTRLLTPEDFGIVALAWLFPTVAVSLFSCGLTSAVPRFYFEYKDDHARLSALVFSAGVFILGGLAITSVGVWFLRGWIADITMGSSAYGLALFVAYVSTYLDQLIQTYLRLYQNEQRAVSHSSYTISRSVVQVGSSLVFVAWLGAGYMGPLYGSLLGATLAAGALWVDFTRRYGRGVRWPDLWDNLVYGLQIVPKTFSGTVNRFFDKYMLRTMLSMSTVGVLSIGQQLASTMNFMISTVWMSFQPEAMREVFDRGTDASASVARMFTIFTYLCLLPIGIMVLFMPELVALIAPPAYEPAVAVVVVLAGTALCQVFGVFVGVQFAYTKRPIWGTISTFIGAGANVLFNIILIPRFGLLGAASAALGASLLVNGIIVVVGQRLYRVEYEWNRLLPLFVVFVAAMTAVLVLRSADPAWTVTYGVKALVLAGFLALGYSSGMLSPAGLRRLRTAFTPGKGA